MAADPGSSTPTTVAVLRSCPTRDNFNSRFNPDYRRYYACPLHQNQTSMIALMSPPLDVRWSPTGEMSDYDRWNVRTEFTRSFLAEVVALRPDYLIVDFFADVHFGVLRLPDGNHVTDNRWKVHHTDWYASALAQGGLDRLTIFDDPDGYLALWEEHYRAFDAFMRRELPETILVVHRGVNVDRLRLPDRRRPVPLQEHVTLRQLDVSLVNRLWRRLDDRAIAISTPEVIDLTAVPWSTWSDHPWGPFYVHYELPYYHRFLAELHRIRLRRGRGGALGPADLAALVDAVDEARREEGALLVDEQRQRAARLRRKLAKRDDGTPE